MAIKPTPNGDCFQTAIVLHGVISRRYPRQSKFVKLVHAMVSGQKDLEGTRYAHAFVLFNDTVFDYSNRQEGIWPKFIYYRAGKIQEGVEGQYVEYDHLEFNYKLIEFEHYGPWDLVEKTFK